MPSVSGQNSKSYIPLALALVLLPAVIFYSILFRTTLNLPLPDDFHAILQFLNVYTTLHTASAKATFLLTEQHGEYRLWFEHAILIAQYRLQGHINLPLLATLGDTSVLLLGFILWRMFLPGTPLQRRLILFAPAAFLTFQLHYADNCNYTMESLQNLPVVPFMLAVVYFLHRPGRAAFLAALASLVLAVAASGNGLFMIFLGVALLLLARRSQELLAWLSVSTVLAAIYFFRYPFAQLLHKQAPVHHSLLQQWLVRKPLFFLAFVGSAASHPIKAVAILLGLLLCAFSVWLVRQGFYRMNPTVSWAFLTLFTTAAGVTYTRAEYGVFSSVSSRYGIYSDLFLVFSWFALAELYLKPQSVSLARSRLYGTALAAAILFSLIMDRFGLHYIRQRNAEARAGMDLYQHSGGTQGPSTLPPGFGAELTESINGYSRPVLARSIALGIYTPPRSQPPIPEP